MLRVSKAQFLSAHVWWGASKRFQITVLNHIHKASRVESNFLRDAFQVTEYEKALENVALRPTFLDEGRRFQ